MADTRDIGGDFLMVGETNAGNLSNSRVWLSRSLCRHTRTHPSLEWRIEIIWLVFEGIETGTQSTRLAFADGIFTLFACELIDG